MKYEIKVLGHSICATLQHLDDGLNVTLFGGSLSHIGSTTVAETDGMMRTISLPGHREHVVTQRWAPKLAAKFGCRTAVTCGIHYDDLTKEQLSTVTDSLEQLLDIILAGDS